MNKNLAWSALALSLFMSLVPVAAHSTLIQLPADAQQTLWAENQCCSDLWSYTYATETWSFSTNITGRFLSLPGTFIDDLGGGAYTVTAHVDHDGNVLGGQFSWVSQSATLGIVSPQTFLSGSILGALQNDSSSAAALWASVDYTNPAIAALTIAPNFAALSFLGGPCWGPCEQSGGFDFFQQDGRGQVVQSDIFGYHVEIPEPGLPLPVWFVLAAIAAAQAAKLRRHDRLRGSQCQARATRFAPSCLRSAPTSPSSLSRA